MNVLTMVAVLRPDVMSLLWVMISLHMPTLTLNVDWSKITITGAEKDVQTVHKHFWYSKYWNCLDLFD